MIRGECPVEVIQHADTLHSSRGYVNRQTTTWPGKRRRFLSSLGKCLVKLHLQIAYLPQKSSTSIFCTGRFLSNVGQLPRLVISPGRAVASVASQVLTSTYYYGVVHAWLDRTSRTPLRRHSVPRKPNESQPMVLTPYASRLEPSPPS